MVEVTCRTIQERHLLRPSPAFNEVVVGVLGRAQRRTGLLIHAVAFMSNHYHLLVSPESAQQLAEFMGYLNGNLAKEAGRLHGWKDRLWSRRYQAISVTAEESAQVGRLRYLLSHGCKEGLVQSPLQWPGVHAARALAQGVALRGTWFDRTREYEARRQGKCVGEQDFAETEEVHLTPLPFWEALTEEQRRELVWEMVRDIEREAEAGGRTQGQQVSGERSVVSQDPHSRPVQPKRSTAPLVHAGSCAARLAFVGAYRLFVGAFRAAAERLRAGDLGVRFPEGSFPPALPFVPVRAG
ncbi:MAG TPA: transposase [Thermoanaerobaculia bacterium]|nr:transposase [Thermoanaerobaculia bacterium]